MGPGEEKNMNANKLRIFLNKWCRPQTHDKDAEFEKDLTELLIKTKCPVCFDDDGFPITEWQRQILFKSMNDLEERERANALRIEKIESKLRACVEHINEANKNMKGE